MKFQFDSSILHGYTRTFQASFGRQYSAYSLQSKVFLALYFQSKTWITYGWSCRGGFTDGKDGRCGGFYIPLAPPLAQKIFPHSFKISYANYTRTAGFCSWQIPCLLLLTAHKIRLFCCRLKLTVERGTAPFQRQRSQKV